MSDENCELDNMYLPSEFFSELESVDTISNSSLSPSRNQDVQIPLLDYSTSINVTQNLFRREMGFGCLKPIKQTFLKSYHLSNIFSHQVLLSHVFLGMTKCGRFLITYTMSTDQDDEEWYATVYKYRLHWWNFKPGGLARKIAEVSLFGNHKIVEPLQMYICQWPKDYEKILVYGIIRECSIDTSGSSNNRHAFITVTALPSLNDCQDCKVVASSYMLDDIAASWDTCLRFSCLKHGYTVHTSFDVVVPYPEFSPKISLKCNDYAVFNANNFLYALKITLGNCEKKIKDDLDDVPYQMNLFAKSDDSNNIVEENTSLYVNHVLHTTPANKALKLKEQIIQDFSEEANLNLMVSPKKAGEFSLMEFHCNENNAGSDESLWFNAMVGLKTSQDAGTSDHLMSPPLPTRVNLIRLGNSDQVFIEPKKQIQSAISSPVEIKREGQEEIASDRDCFRCPLSPGQVKRTRGEQKKITTSEKNRTSEKHSSENSNCSKKCYKSFFTRHKVQKNNFNFGMFIRGVPFSKSMIKSSRSLGENPVLDSNKYRCRNTIDNADSPYEFVDDAQHEVEKLSQFRKKRLAEKKYEFQDFDSENIVPFSIVRLENTMRSPKKISEMENDVAERLSLNIELRFNNDGMSSNEMNDAILRSPSPKYPMDLSVSVPSPRSPLIVEILPSPTQYEGVLRPFNRNTSGNMLLSPIMKYLSSPPANSQKLTSKSTAKDYWKTKGCDELKIVKVSQIANNSKNSNNLDTRVILENGILINDISEWYFKEKIYSEEMDIYKNLFRNLNKFHGEAVRFERRFVDVDDELISVITDIEDDDMSAVTGYHTALNVEVHGAGYSQLQMISNSKVEKLAAPCVVVDQQSLDIEAICHSVATTLCQVSNKTFTFCNDYDIEILDVCPRSGDVLVLLMMRIEGAEGIRDEVSELEQYEASVTLVWNLHCGSYKVCMVVPPQKVNWAWNSKAVWNPAKEASKRFRMHLPADVTFCDPAVRVCRNNSTLKGISLARIEDLENGLQFIL